MPEGPSIYILKEELALFKGKKVVDAVSDKPTPGLSVIKGQKIIALKTWGKHLLICFPKVTVRIHLLMFGTYYINDKKDNDVIPRLGLRFAKGELNFYTCAVKIIEGPLDDVYDWDADIMSKSWSVKKAVAKLKEKPTMLVCDALLDQGIFSGAGNIIKNEVLFRIKVHPKTQIGNMPPIKLKALAEETPNYAFDFLKWKKAGVLKKHWLAHTKSICPRDGDEIHKEYLGKTKRRTYYCNTCQKLYK